MENQAKKGPGTGENQRSESVLCHMCWTELNLWTVPNGGALSDLGRQLPHLDNEKRTKKMKRPLIVK